MLPDFFDNYAVYEYPLATAQLFLAMLGMGALLTPADFLREIRTPKGLLLGIGFQWVAVPLVALAVGSVLSLPAGIAAGLVLIAAVPGGTLSNILTLFGRGNIALSISLTSITTVASLATTPIILQLFMGQYLPADFDMPTARIARDIMLTLILPLMLGMTVRLWLSIELTALLSRWMIRISLFLIVIMAIGAGGSGRLDARAYGISAIVALLTFCFALQVLGLLASRLARLEMPDGLAIVVEGTFRNISLAVALKAIVFPARPGELDPIGDAVLFSAMLYGGISMFLSLVPVLLHRRYQPTLPD